MAPIPDLGPNSLTLCCTGKAKCPEISQNHDGFLLRDDAGAEIRLSTEEAVMMARWIRERFPHEAG